MPDESYLAVCMCAQVLDLGEIQATDSWHEGAVRYEKLVTIPDYDRCPALAPTLQLPGSALTPSPGARHVPACYLFGNVCVCTGIATPAHSCRPGAGSSMVATVFACLGCMMSRHAGSTGD